MIRFPNKFSPRISFDARTYPPRFFYYRKLRVIVPSIHYRLYHKNIYLFSSLYNSVSFLTVADHWHHRFDDAMRSSFENYYVHPLSLSLSLPSPIDPTLLFPRHAAASATTFSPLYRCHEVGHGLICRTLSLSRSVKRMYVCMQ